MDDATMGAYKRMRAKYPFMAAALALRWAKDTHTDRGWNEDGYQRWTKERDGFHLVLSADVESAYPKPGDSYGDYVDEVHRDYAYEWGGNYPMPAVDRFPLGLPYTAFRYDGSNRQGDGGYFVPEDIEGQYAAFRRMGQSASVAWDLTREWIETYLGQMFGSPLTYMDVDVTAYRAGIKLGSASMGTSVFDDADGEAHIFEVADDLIEEAIDDAQLALERLATTTSQEG